jgi:hypothetical protein
MGSLFWGFTFHGPVVVVMFGCPEGPDVDYRTSVPSWLPFLPLGKFMNSGVLSVRLQILLRPASLNASQLYKNSHSLHMNTQSNMNCSVCHNLSRRMFNVQSLYGKQRIKDAELESEKRLLTWTTYSSYGNYKRTIKLWECSWAVTARPSGRQATARRSSEKGLFRKCGGTEVVNNYSIRGEY